MDEIDNIIIDSLRQLHCEFGSEVTGLKHFDCDMVVSAIACCLEAIIPGSKFPHKLPPNMSQRLKIAMTLAEQIQQLGFRGDMGYQTILYCNEVEVRRVLMFLVERLPREPSKTAIVEETGYVAKLAKEIEERMRMHLEKPWVPADLLPCGARPCGGYYLSHSFGDSHPLRTTQLHLARTNEAAPDAWKQYWARYLPDVTKQCNQSDLMPSLLFNDAKFEISLLDLKQTAKAADIPEITEAIIAGKNSNRANETAVKETIAPQRTELPGMTQEEDIKTKHGEMHKKMLSLQEELKKSEAKLTVLSNVENKEQEALNETLAKIKIKTKTLTVLSKEDNMAKLKALVENGSARLVHLANQWNDMQAPLLEQYRELQNNISTRELEIRQEQAKLNGLREAKAQLQADLVEKEDLEKQLAKKLEKMSNNVNRSAYTRRILEIIANIKKQEADIAKILKDAKDVQKDINILNGQVERSFVLSDELIFRDAKQDEMARKAYKLLVALHNECGEVMKCVTDLGLAERESRNLQEQLDAESAKDTASKLQRVTADLELIRTETDQLLKNL